MKQTERKNCDRDQNRFRRDAGPAGAANRSVKRARMEEPVRAVLMNTGRPQACGIAAECIKESDGSILGLVFVVGLRSIGLRIVLGGPLRLRWPNKGLCDRLNL